MIFHWLVDTRTEVGELTAAIIYHLKNATFNSQVIHEKLSDYSKKNIILIRVHLEAYSKLSW